MAEYRKRSQKRRVVQINTSHPPEMAAYIRRRAEELDIGVSAFIRRAVRAYRLQESIRERIDQEAA